MTAILTMALQQLEDAAGVVSTASDGIVPIADALRLAQRAHPVLVVFDHNGRPLHLGRTRRLASADQRLALIAASRGCTRPGCDGCHGLVKDGPRGWATDRAEPGSEYAGRTRWTPPAYVDPARTPRVNHRHHLHELFGILHAVVVARAAEELREWRSEWDPNFEGYRHRRTRGEGAGRGGEGAASGEGAP